MKKIIYAIAFVALIASCGENKVNKAKESTKKVADKITEVKIETPKKLHGDSVLLGSFDVEIKLTERAAKKLKEAKETIIIALFYTADPKDKTSNDYLENGNITVLSKDIELPVGTYTATIPGYYISKEKFDSLEKPEITVTANIISGRKSSEYNLLSSPEIIAKPIEKVKGTKVIFDTDLI